MNKIQWQINNYLTVGNEKIACEPNLENGYNQDSGIKFNSEQALGFKFVVWPFFKFRNDLLVDGFIEKGIGKLIRKHLCNNSIYLDIGCGDMSLRSYVPGSVWYNALDIELSYFHI